MEVKKLLFPTEFKSRRLLATFTTSTKNFPDQEYIYKVSR